MTEIIALVFLLNTVMWLAAVGILVVYIDRKIDERIGRTEVKP